MKNKKTKNISKKNTQNKQVKQNRQKSSLIKGLILISVYALFSFILEIINFKMLGFGFLPENLLFDLAFWLIVAGLLFLIPNNIAQIVVSAVLLGLQIFINLVNQTLIKNTGLVFHWHQLSQSGNATQSLESDMVNFGLISVYILLFASFLVVAILLKLKLKNDFEFSFSKRLVFWLVTAFAFVIGGTSFIFIANKVREDVYKKAYAFTKDNGKSFADGVYFKNATFRMMGTFGFYFHDMVTNIEATQKASAGEIKLMRETLDKSIIQNEDGFMAKGDNLIYILLESFDMFSIDPYNTPNLWKMAYGGESESANKNVKWGYTFENFHGLNYTNNSEIISLLGHTTEKMTFADYYKDSGVVTPYSLPNLFKGAKYQNVNFFHSYSKEYYDRENIYKAFGFDNVYGLEDSTLSNKSSQFGDWVLDSAYIDSMMDKFIPEEKAFFSYFTTVSTHGPYNEPNGRFASYGTTYDKNLENYKKFLEKEEQKYPENKRDQQILREYKMRVMDIDLMIGKIFERLAKLNILETTTIILFSDHNCFYNDLNAKIKGINTSDFSNIESNNIPLIIYNDEMAARKSSVFCNTYDLYATICHMFGLEYNSMLTQGHSIFGGDISKSIHVSFKHGVFNQDYYTDDLVKIKSLTESPAMTKDKFKTEAYEFFKKQETIEFVYRNNVYGKQK